MEVPVDKKIATLQTLIKNSGIKEVQSMDNVPKNVGMNIRDIEFRRPIKQVDAELDDVDNIKMILYGYLGGTSRALGKENAYTQKFDELYGKYTIDIIDDLKYKIESGQVQESQAEVKTDDKS